MEIEKQEYQGLSGEYMPEVCIIEHPVARQQSEFVVWESRKTEHEGVWYWYQHYATNSMKQAHRAAEDAAIPLNLNIYMLRVAEVRDLKHVALELNPGDVRRMQLDELPDPPAWDLHHASGQGMFEAPVLLRNKEKPTYGRIRPSINSNETAVDA